MKYNFLIVGAGLAGLTCARLLTDAGQSCVVVEKDDVIGGNCRESYIDGVKIHEFGPHIFHTDYDHIYGFVFKHTNIRPYRYLPLVRYKDQHYSFPINLLTLKQVFGDVDFKELTHLVNSIRIHGLSNLYGKDLSVNKLVDIFFKDYSEKQWGIPFEEIPKSYLDRIPISAVYDDLGYFKNSKYQGIIDFEMFFNSLGDGIDIILGKSFNQGLEKIAYHIIYTGSIDEYFDYKFGKLEYRTLDFFHSPHNRNYWQGTAVINHTSKDVKYTRSIEHKFLTGQDCSNTVVSFEHPRKAEDGDRKFYPVSSDENRKRLTKYCSLANEYYYYVTFLGRLGTYQYLNMDEVIAQCMSVLKKKEFI